MPHIIVNIIEGKSNEIKQEFAEKMVQLASDTLGIKPAAFSVVFKEFAKEDWMSEVYQKDIKPNLNSLSIKPGYSD